MNPEELKAWGRNERLICIAQLEEARKGAHSLAWCGEQAEKRRKLAGLSYKQASEAMTLSAKAPTTSADDDKSSAFAKLIVTQRRLRAAEEKLKQASTSMKLPSGWSIKQMDPETYCIANEKRGAVFALSDNPQGSHVAEFLKALFESAKTTEAKEEQQTIAPALTMPDSDDAILERAEDLVLEEDTRNYFMNSIRGGCGCGHPNAHPPCHACSEPINLDEAKAIIDYVIDRGTKPSNPDTPTTEAESW